MRDHGMPADMEVRGMFGAAMDELRRAASDADAWAKAEPDRRGAIPDIVATVAREDADV